MGAYVNIIAPDGTAGRVPAENAQAAVNAGGKIGIHVYAPDGTAGFIPHDQLPAALKAGATAVPSQVPSAPPQPAGFADSLYANSPLSIPQSVIHAIMHPVDTAEGVGNELARSGSQLKEAWNTPNDQPIQAIDRTLYSVPFVGGALKSADAAAAKGDYGEASGTSLGVLSSLLAPGVVKGAAGLDTLNPLPSKAAAGSVFDNLNQQLADHPVPLNEAVAPLQRATEVGVRGSNLPPAVKALLDRSQATEPMTFPEARDYQASLSDLSTSDKLAMNGRMRGAVSQLNKALFTDIKNAADAKGLGEDYQGAMTEYRRASQVSNALKNAGKIAVPAIVGGGIASHYLKDMVPK